MVTSKSRKGLPVTVPEAKSLHKKKTELALPITTRKLTYSLEINCFCGYDELSGGLRAKGFKTLLSFMLCCEYFLPFYTQIISFLPLNLALTLFGMLFLGILMNMMNNISITVNCNTLSSRKSFTKSSGFNSPTRRQTSVIISLWRNS